MISIAEYDNDRSELTLHFRNQSIYLYRLVPLRVYEELVQSRSSGSFFREYIEGRYPFVRIPS